ncbi:MAG: hypothetical protein ACR2JY_03250 [Chloroflexota bacterium]
MRGNERLFGSRKKGLGGEHRAISRLEAWQLVKNTSVHARVRVLAQRPSPHAPDQESALTQKQAGWSRLQMAYLTIGDEEARELMRGVTE